MACNTEIKKKRLAYEKAKRLLLKNKVALDMEEKKQRHTVQEIIKEEQKEVEMEARIEDGVAE